MAGQCPTCGKPFGVRKRCYSCSPGKVRTGCEVACSVCGTMFYAQLNQILDIERQAATYCSVPCKNKGMTGRETRPGKRYVRRDGYVAVKTGVRKYELEHRLVMAEALGRPLRKDEHVHHLDGNKQHNDLTNLVLLTPSEHEALHAATDHVRAQSHRVTLICKRCGAEYERKRGRVAESNYCSAACRLEVQHEAARAHWAARRAAKE